MKEKFKQIAEQSGFVLWEEWNQGEVIDWSSVYDKELEKFAENIIDEICSLIMKNEYNLMPNLRMRMTGDAEVYMIQKHFGIEK